MHTSPATLTEELKSFQFQDVGVAKLDLLILVLDTLFLLLDGVLDVEGLFGESLGIRWRVTDVNVVNCEAGGISARCPRPLQGPHRLTENVVGHRPQLESNTAQRRKQGRVEIFEERWVLDLTWGPWTLVIWVWNHRSDPFTLSNRMCLISLAGTAGTPCIRYTPCKPGY